MEEGQAAPGRILYIRPGVSFWVESEPPHLSSATPEALAADCFRGAVCVDGRGAMWAVTDAHPTRPSSLLERLVPGARIPVSLELGPRRKVDVGDVLPYLSDVLDSDNEFVDEVGEVPADVVAALRRAPTVEALIEHVADLLR